MTSRKKIAVVSWVLGGLAVTCVGVAQAQDGSAGDCTSDARGSVTCTQKSENVYTSEDGRYHVHQTRKCTTTSEHRLVRPQSSVGKKGTTKIGPSLECSNSAPAPEHFTAPHIVR